MECVICKEPIWNIADGVVLRQKGANGINNASKERGDAVNVTTGESIHKICRANYTKPQNIAVATRETPKVEVSIYLDPKLRNLTSKSTVCFVVRGIATKAKRRILFLYP